MGVAEAAGVFVAVEFGVAVEVAPLGLLGVHVGQFMSFKGLQAVAVANAMMPTDSSSCIELDITSVGGVGIGVGIGGVGVALRF